jgi:hypothetical protein
VARQVSRTLYTRDAKDRLRLAAENVGLLDIVRRHPGEALLGSFMAGLIAALYPETVCLAARELAAVLKLKARL